MRAMQLVRPGRVETLPLELVDRPDPAPGPGEILVGVTACGVCRTDLQLCEGDLEARSLPVVPGHQAVGRVLAVGSALGTRRAGGAVLGLGQPTVSRTLDYVRAWAPGDRVGLAWLAGADGTCAHCVEGRENLCTHARFTGWDRDGGFATHLVARADFALEIPPGFGDLDAAPLLCGGVIGYRSLKVSGVRPGQRLGLYGFGASATLAIQVARHWGCRVFVCTRSGTEQLRARALGAEWAGGYDELPPEPLDAAVTFAPSGDVVVAALRALDRGGTVAINAIHLDRVPEIPYRQLWWERTIRSVANFTRTDARELLRLASEIPIRPEYEVLPLEDANVALQRVARGDVHGAAVLRCA